MAFDKGGDRVKSPLKSQQPWEVEVLEWRREDEGLLKGSGRGLYGIKEALERGERQLTGLLPRHRVTELLAAPNGLQT